MVKKINNYCMCCGRCINREVKNYPGKNRMFQKKCEDYIDSIRAGNPDFDIKNYIKYKTKATQKTKLITQEDKKKEQDYYFNQKKIAYILFEKRLKAEEKFLKEIEYDFK
jgi:hypothetical protein